MCASPRFVSGSVEYRAALVRLLLPPTEFPGLDPVRSVRIESDGKEMKLTVALGPFEIENIALEAAEAAVERLWGALLVKVPDCFTSATPPSRRHYSLEPAPQVGVVYAPAACLGISCGSVGIAMTPGTEVLQAIRDLSTAKMWNPTVSPAFELFERALREPDSVLQFLALYTAVIWSMESARGEGYEPSQAEIDAEFRRVDPTVPMLPPEGEKGKPEAPFTRARNRLLHPKGRRISWEDARAYAAGQLQTFRALVAKRVIEAVLAQGS